MIAAALIALQGLLVFLAPAAVAILLALTASYSDSRGIVEQLDIIFPGYLLYCRILFSVLILYAVARYAVFKRKGMQRSTRVMCDAAICLCMFSIISFIANGHGLFRGVQDLYFNPISYILIFLVFFDGRENYLFSFVGIQIALAICIITIPALEVLDARQFIALQGSYVGGGSYEGVGSIDFETVNKIDIGQYAQFQNPNTLGFYAGVAIAYGVGGVARWGFNNRKILPYIGLAAGGIFCWLASLTRGPIIGILLASVSIFFYKSKAAWFIVGIALVLLVNESFMKNESFVGGMLDYLFISATDISITGRVQGYLNGAAAVIDSPVWGVTNQWNWDVGVPHILPLQVASFYGLPAALILIFIVYFIPIVAFVKIWKSGLIRDSMIALQVYAVLVAISFTNNAPGTCLFGFALAYVHMNNISLLKRHRHKLDLSD